MKKSVVFLPVVLFVILSIVSCTFLGWGVAPSDTTDGTDATTGTLVINLGSSGRTIYEASEESTVRYLVEITGPNDFSLSEQFAKSESSMRFQLVGGFVYKVTITALNSKGIATAWATNSIRIIAGEIATPEFIFTSRENLVATDYYLWNMVSGEGDPYILSKSSQKPNSLVVGSENGGVGASCSASAEDAQGNWYYLAKKSDNPNRYDIKRVKITDGTVDSLITLQADSEPIDDALYYDVSTDKLWVCDSSGFVVGYDLKNPSDETAIILLWDVEPVNISTFAVHGEFLYIGYKLDEDYKLGVWQWGAKYGDDGNITGYDVDEDATNVITSDEGECTDIAIVDDQIYALFCDSPLEVNITNAHSCGALVKLSTDLETIVEPIGWLNTARELNSSLPDGASVPSNSIFVNKIDGNDIEWKAADVPSSIEIITPDNETAGFEDSKYFYGPRRFVAIRPKELCIVDCGISVRLTDWKDGTENCHPTPGMTYIHNRVVSVDLADFSLKPVAEEIENAPTYYTSALFTKIHISGVSAGYSNQPVLAYEKDGIYYYYAPSEDGYLKTTAAVHYMGTVADSEEE